jgi:hypothetical protein
MPQIEIERKDQLIAVSVRVTGSQRDHVEPPLSDILISLTRAHTASELGDRDAGRHRYDLFYRIELCVFPDGILMNPVLLPTGPLVGASQLMVKSSHSTEDHVAVH